MLRIMESMTLVLNAAELLANVLGSVVMAMVGTAWYSQSVFLVVGIVVCLGVPTLYVLPLRRARPPLTAARGVLPGLRENWHGLAYIAIFYLGSAFGDSMFWYYLTDIIPEGSQQTFAASAFLVIFCLTVSFSGLLFTRVRYRRSLLVAFATEALAYLLLAALPDGLSVGARIAFIVAFGFVVTVGDGLGWIFALDLAEQSPFPLFMNAIANSVQIALYTAGSVAFPQLREATSWRTFWLVGVAVEAALAAAAFVVLRLAHRDLYSRPVTAFWRNAPDGGAEEGAEQSLNVEDASVEP
eukprot:gnl/Chilomastix_cuspidata/5898.p3 GENE.gnl/Chilomastix_cuspidata/5898~~gnl/Chilomastix_cuspidata/5898.p3  ORF type:complete len:298 (+),score=122.64 gnl/Chilomastix_cuspidata/5898:415-1308(+)